MGNLNERESKKFIVINERHLEHIQKTHTFNEVDKLLTALLDLQSKLPRHQYLVVNQDETYADIIKDIIELHELAKEKKVDLKRLQLLRQGLKTMIGYTRKKLVEDQSQLHIFPDEGE